jgi:hypothetical protein
MKSVSSNRGSKQVLLAVKSLDVIKSWSNATSHRRRNGTALLTHRYCASFQRLAFAYRSYRDFCRDTKASTRCNALTRKEKG